MPSGLEIQKSLRALAVRWREYAGSERGAAQTFLNELFECYGTDRHAVGAKFEDAQAAVGIIDLYWSVAVAQDDAELVRRLLERNAAVAAGTQHYAPFVHSPPPQ